MAVNALSRLINWSGRPGPLVVVVMDGVGLGVGDEFDAVHRAYMPNFKGLMAQTDTLELAAHGTAVGLPSDGDMGNSEVGHNALGAGRIFPQGARLVNQALESGGLFRTDTWSWLTKPCVKGQTLHFMGLLSDGNVHSHIEHLKAMISRAKDDGVRRVRIHALLDGRDVAPRSALTYLRDLQAFLSELLTDDPGLDYVIASGGGRMIITMDRYEAEWSMVEMGWKHHVLGEGRAFESAEQAVETLRDETDKDDQFLPPFVIHRGGKAVGPIEDGDGVVFFNYRGDRALEITQAFEGGTDFDKFDRVRVPKIRYAGMMQYDGDLNLPERFLVEPPSISQCMSEYLAATGVAQFACSETQKYGHVTYFWNGNRSGFFNEQLETFVEVKSDVIPFEQRPWMKAAEITDATLAGLKESSARFARINFPNGDMVGHTGVLDATIVGLEAMDLSLGRLLKGIKAMGGMAIITADHGNAEDMVMRGKDNKPKRNSDGEVLVRSSHSLNPVPFVVYDPHFAGEYRLRQDVTKPGLANIAATVLNLLGYNAPSDYEESLIEFVDRSKS